MLHKFTSQIFRNIVVVGPLTANLLHRNPHWSFWRNLNSIGWTKNQEHKWILRLAKRSVGSAEGEEGAGRKKKDASPKKNRTKKVRNADKKGKEELASAKEHTSSESTGPIEEQQAFVKEHPSSKEPDQNSTKEEYIRDTKQRIISSWRYIYYEAKKLHKKKYRFRKIREARAAAEEKARRDAGFEKIRIFGPNPYELVGHILSDVSKRKEQIEKFMEQEKALRKEENLLSGIVDYSYSILFGGVISDFLSNKFYVIQDIEYFFARINQKNRGSEYSDYALLSQELYMTSLLYAFMNAQRDRLRKEKNRYSKDQKERIDPKDEDKSITKDDSSKDQKERIDPKDEDKSITKDDSSKDQKERIDPKDEDKSKTKDDSSKDQKERIDPKDEDKSKTKDGGPGKGKRKGKKGKNNGGDAGAPLSDSPKDEDKSKTKDGGPGKGKRKGKKGKNNGGDGGDGGDAGAPLSDSPKVDSDYPLEDPWDVPPYPKDDSYYPNPKDDSDYPNPKDDSDDSDDSDNPLEGLDFPFDHQDTDWDYTERDCDDQYCDLNDRDISLETEAYIQERYESVLKSIEEYKIKNRYESFSYKKYSDPAEYSEPTKDFPDQDQEGSKNFAHLWVQCENCYGINYKKYFFQTKLNICEHCGSHLKMSSSERIDLPVDPGTWVPMDEDMISTDPIEFDRNTTKIIIPPIEFDRNPTKIIIPPNKEEEADDTNKDLFCHCKCNCNKKSCKKDQSSAFCNNNRLFTENHKKEFQFNICLCDCEKSKKEFQCHEKNCQCDKSKKEFHCHEKNCQCHEKNCQCHETNCQCHETNCQCHETNCQCHETNCQCHICLCDCEKSNKTNCQCHKINGIDLGTNGKPFGTTPKTKIHVYSNGDSHAGIKSDDTQNPIALYSTNTADHINMESAESDKGNSKSESDEGNSKYESDEGNSKSESDEGNSKSESDEGNSKYESDEGNSKSEEDEGNSKSEEDEGNSKSEEDEGNSKSEEDEGNSKSESSKGNYNKEYKDKGYYNSESSKGNNKEEDLDDSTGGDGSEEKDYKARLHSYQEETGLTEAIQTGTGQLKGIPVAIGVMDFQFIGGSMGSVVGEKITRLIEYATKNFLPVILVCASGGARMQEGSLSLMQMAKISAALHRHQTNKKLLYISILTTPTTGGVTASFGMLGDLNFAEPNADIAFAGKRVIEQTLNLTVPEGIQTAENLFQKGLLDLIVPRNILKNLISELLKLHAVNKNQVEHQGE
uniref:acetyl-CoA carboxylase carboxyltransferase beta subunit n=1 Tax=Selenicereus megalanthus TaxID=1195127 RepID=UPI0030E11ACF